MATLEELKTLHASVPTEVQSELFLLFTSDPEASFQKMVELAAQCVTLTAEETKGFLKQMDEDEFDDIELDAAALAAIAEGRNGGKRLAC